MKNLYMFLWRIIAIFLWKMVKQYAFRVFTHKVYFSKKKVPLSKTKPPLNLIQLFKLIAVIVSCLCSHF